jgi:chromosome segregation ATPase
VSEDAVRGLEETLRAALADEQAAGLLLAGQLTDALHTSDFGSGFGSGSDIADVIPISRKASAGSRSQSDSHSAQPERAPRDEQRQRAEYALAEASRALANATSVLHDLLARVEDASQAAVSAHSRVEELRLQLEAAGSAASDADRHRRELASELERAERAVRGAERRNVEAQERRDRLAKSD